MILSEPHTHDAWIASTNQGPWRKNPSVWTHCLGNIDIYIYIHTYIYIYPLVMTNIAMRNGPSIDGLPNLKMVIFHGKLLNNQRVYI